MNAFEDQIAKNWTNRGAELKSKFKIAEQNEKTMAVELQGRRLT